MEPPSSKKMTLNLASEIREPSVMEKKGKREYSSSLKGFEKCSNARKLAPLRGTLTQEKDSHCCLHSRLSGSALLITKIVVLRATLLLQIGHRVYSSQGLLTGPTSSSWLQRRFYECCCLNPQENRIYLHLLDRPQVHIRGQDLKSLLDSRDKCPPLPFTQAQQTMWHS